MQRFIKSYANDAAIQAAVDDKSLGKPYVALDDELHKIDWNTKSDAPDYSKMYLTIEALSGGTFYVRNANVGYSVNGGEWETTTGETALSLNQGDKVRFKGTAGGNSLFSGNTLAFNAYGNIESLEYGDNFIGVTTIKGDYAPFGWLFGDCTGLSEISNVILPATTLSLECYAGIFQGCTSVESSPKLPSTTLSQGCYNQLFYGCTSLVNAPELPATSLTMSCYRNMFQGCTSLVEAPDLPALTVPSYSYAAMFWGCRNLNYIKCLATDISAIDATGSWVYEVSIDVGTFVKKAGATWPTGGSGIPGGWTVIEE